MVANIRTGATVGGAVRYNEEKVNRGVAEVLFWNRMLDPFDTAGRMSHERCMASFEPFLQANRRTTNTVFHVSLNPSPEDRLTDEQLGEIAREYMERMGYGEQPYIVFKHGDIAREHLHIVSLRIDSTGRNFSANAFEQQIHTEAEGRRVYRNTTEQDSVSKVCLRRNFQICKYNDSCFQINSYSVLI